MEAPSENQMVTLDFEVLEERVVPGLLTVTPVASVVSSDSYIVRLPFAPNVGLTNAQEHSGGVVQWTPAP